MTTTRTTMAPDALLIKLSARQFAEFTACAKTCGLHLVDWIVQCADVQAAAVIDALQASERGERPIRKQQRPRTQAELARGSTRADRRAGDAR